MMRRGLGIGLCLFSLVIPPVTGQMLGETKNSATVSLDVTEAYLEDVLKILSKESKINFVAAEEVRSKTVTTYLEKVPIEAALETLLKANRLDLKQGREKNLYVIVPSTAPKVETITRIYALKFARVLPSAGESSGTFGLSGSLIQEVLESSSGTGGGGGGGRGGGGGFGGGGGGGAGGSAGSETSGIVPIIKTLLTEHGSLVSDRRTNSLIITDIPERFPLIEETIQKLDVKPPQLYIEGEILEVTLSTLRRIGIEYGNTAGTVVSYTGPTATGFFPLELSPLYNDASKTTGTFSFLTSTGMLLKLLATESDTRILARPRLLTLSNEVAEIRIVSETSTAPITTTFTQTTTTATSQERSTVGTVLRVTPMVNDGKYVTMVIEPEVSRVVTSTRDSTVLDPQRRSARTTVMVPTGATAMIAGLISTEDTQAARRIPGLGDIPILGLPFKRTETERENTEIILFITPHILKDDVDSIDSAVAQIREQTPITGREESRLQAHRKHILKERALEETIENLAR